MQGAHEETFAHLIGADAFAGKRSLLALLREPRFGELAVMDAKTLAETRTIRTPFCEDAEGKEPAAKGEKGEKADKAE